MSADIDPKPMDPERLADLREASCSDEPQDLDVYGLLSEHVPELLADRVWHRARVEVTDDDIRAAGLGDPDVCDECPRLLGWAAAQSSIYLVTGSNDHQRGHGFVAHGFWAGHPFEEDEAEMIAKCSGMAHDWIINELARALGRPPLDVLADQSGRPRRFVSGHNMRNGQ